MLMFPCFTADHFPRDRRFEYLILTAENVLTADTVRYVSALCQCYVSAEAYSQSYSLSAHILTLE